MGWVWDYLATPLFPQYQFPSVRLWFEPRTTSPAPPLNNLPSDRLWFEFSKASSNSAVLNKFALNVRSGFGWITLKTRNPFRGSAAEAPLTKTSAEEPRGSTASENLPVVFAEVSRKVRGSSRAEASLFQVYL